MWEYKLHYKSIKDERGKRMRSKQLISLAAVAILFLMGACGPQDEGSTEVTELDRPGLVDLMTDYFEALVNKDPSKVPIAADIKFVENTADIPVGDGLWVTASGGPSEFRIDAADPKAQQVASLAMMKEYEG